MKAVIHYHPGHVHQVVHAAAMRAGLQRHGVDVAYASYDTPTVRAHDFAVIWGAPSKQPAVAASSARILVMERGHVGDRMATASCGWDGLGRHGRYPAAADGGERWRRRYGELLEPWTERRGYALVIGQVDGDAALRGLVVKDWVEQQLAALHALGWETRFRPHPLVSRPARTLREDLAGAALCVTYNSTAGVEAVLAGVPTVTLDDGAMAWPVAGHALEEIVRPDREAWAHDLAYTSWTPEEIGAGEAWERLAPIMEAPCLVA